MDERSGFPRVLTTNLRSTRHADIDGVGLNIYSDATLIINNNQNKPIFRVSFKDLFPYYLSPLEFNSQVTDVEYLHVRLVLNTLSTILRPRWWRLLLMIDLPQIQKMWEQDSKIDPDNLHTESLNIPVLHAKYYDLYNNLILLRKKAEQQRKNIRHERYEYFSGKADPDVYVKNPFPKKIRDKDTMQKYLDADEKLSNSSLKIDYYDTMLKYLEEILKQISNRTYQIKND